MKYQGFRFRNAKTDPDQLMYMTGLTLQIWNTLWEFLEPSLEDVLSAKSAAIEERGRINFSGAGRKPALSQEDQLLMTLMRRRLARNEQDLAFTSSV